MTEIKSCPKAKRKGISLETKCTILEKLENGESATSLAETYGISKSTISSLKRDKESIIKIKNTLAICDGNMNRKRYRKTEEKEYEQKIYAWFIQRRAMGWPVTGPMLKKQALNYHRQLGCSDEFKASNGWLSLFKKRHGIKCLNIQDEKSCTDPTVSESFKEILSNIVNNASTSLDLVYNCDETGLYWKLLPDTPLILKNEKPVEERKKPKNRVTVMLCSNASGTHKLPPFVIGKSEQPRCFQTVNELPVEYCFQRNACMDKPLMMQWYTTIFLPEVQKKHNLGPEKKVILIMDNAACHPTVEEFNDVSNFCSIIFLPPYITTFVQPLNQGIVEKFKKTYRNILIEQIVFHQSLDENEDFFRVLNLLRCCTFIAMAWDEITANDIRNCWIKLFPCESVPPLEILDTFDIHMLVKQIPFLGDVSYTDTNNWLNVDSHETGWEPVSDSSILFGKNEENSIEELEDEVLMDDENDDGSKQNVSENINAVDAVTAIRKYLQWYQKQDFCNNSEILQLHRFEQKAIGAAIDEGTKRLLR